MNLYLMSTSKPYFSLLPLRIPPLAIFLIYKSCDVVDILAENFGVGLIMPHCLTARRTVGALQNYNVSL